MIVDCAGARWNTRRTLHRDLKPGVQKPLAQEGTILGMFQYMAPEQLEASEADARTDIFAKRAFVATSKASLIAAIVKEQPRPISEIQPLTPPAFEHVVAKCLAKDPERRFSAILDDLREMRAAGGNRCPPRNQLLESGFESEGG